MRAALALFLFVTGCSAADPCDGISGSCLSARIEGDAKALDALRVSLGASGGMMTSMPGGTFDLPVRIAIVLPASATSPAAITIDGLAGGQTRASSGEQSVAFVVGGKSSFTFHLTSGTGDGGVGDGGPPPGVVSFFPSTIDFGALDRGQVSAAKSVTLYNNTTHAVMLTNSPEPTGDGDVFNIDPATTTCFAADAGMMPMIMLQAMSSCTIGFVFQPTRSGHLMMSISAMFDDGESAGFSVSGIANRVWAPELINIGTTINLQGVWGSSHTDIYAVGSNPGFSGVFHSAGDGNWSQDGTPTSSCSSVSGVDAQHVWIGCGASQLFRNIGGPAWQLESSAYATGTARGLFARDATNAFAANDSPGQVMQNNGPQPTVWNGILPTATPNQLLAICGTAVGLVAVGRAGTWVAYDTMNHVLTVMGTFTGVDLNGCWMSDDNSVWIVGNNSGGSGPGLIEHCVLQPGGGTPNCTQQTPGQSQGTLYGISGWHDVANNNKLEMWVVGAIGNQVLTSDGAGTWNHVQTPNNQAMLGVWVSPTNGEVMAVGYSGQVNHLY
jgi:hypothetical protein